MNSRRLLTIFLVLFWSALGGWATAAPSPPPEPDGTAAALAAPNGPYAAPQPPPDNGANPWSETTPQMAPAAEPELPVQLNQGLAVPAAGPAWIVGVDALWLERTVGSSEPLALNVRNPPAGPPAVAPDELFSDDELFPLTSGARIQVGYRIDDAHLIEAQYFGLQQWSVGRQVVGDPIGDTVLVFSPWTQTDSLIGGFNNYVGYVYGSRVDNVELNERVMLGSSPFGRSLTGLAGFRYFHLSDTFTLSGSDLDTGDFENLDFKTNNNLLGLQLGLQFRHDWDRFQLSAEMKAGVFANLYTEQGSNLDSSGVISGNPAGFIPFTESNHGTDVSGLFELNVSARYGLTPHWWLRAGYQSYWVTGLALAPRQLGGVNHSGSVTLDGPSLGLEAMW